MIKWLRLFGTLGIAGALACSDDGPAEPEGPEDTSPTVAVRNNFFDPSAIDVATNGTVTWQWNSGGVEHNVTFPSGPSSGNRSSGSFARTFDTEGSYPYVCTIHEAEGMTGVVNVTTSSSTGDGGDDTGDDTGSDPGY